MKKYFSNYSKLISFDFKLLSKYRTELMGIGALGVILGHNLRWNEWPFFAALLGRIISSLVFTEGFLFLSGFGLFFSFVKNSNLKDFYLKRFERLVIPFWLTILPFAILNLIFGFKDISSVLNEFSIVAWFWGDGSWWYIAVSLLLYSLFPFIYKLVIGKMGEGNICSSVVKTFLLVVLVWLVNLFVLYLFPAYYKEVEIGLPQIPAFFFGVLAGLFAYKNYQSTFWMPVTALCLVIFYGFSVFYEPLYSSYLIALRLFCMTVICKMFVSNLFVFFNPFLRWCGKYSLELYLIHLAAYILISKFQVNSVWLNHLNILLAFALCKPFNLLSSQLVRTLKLSRYIS